MEAGAGLPDNRDEYLESFWLNSFKSPSSPYPVNDNASLSIEEAPAVTNAGRATIQDMTIVTDPSRKREDKNKQSYLTYDEDSEHDYTTSPFASTYERVAGGTGNHWMGTSLRMADNDLRLKTRYGMGEDWPAGITAESLAPYYARAERRIGVSADANEQREHTNAYIPDDYEYPMKALSRSLADDMVAEAIKGKTLTDDNPDEAYVTGTPAGRNSEPYQGRRVCHGNTNCAPICPIQAKYDPTYTLGLALDTGNVELWTKTVVDRVNIDANTRVESLHYRQYEDLSIPAKTGEIRKGEVGDGDTIFVLAANAIENAKILLASPWGSGTAANKSGKVGRGLMDHPTFLAWGLATKPVYGYRGPLSTAGIENLRDGDFRKDRAAWRVELGNDGWNWPIVDPYTSMEDWLNGTNNSGTNPEKEVVLGTKLVAKANDVLTRQVRMAFLIEQEIDDDNRVTLSTKYRDNLGIARPQIEYTISRYTAKGARSASEAATKVFELMGIPEHERWYALGSESKPRFDYDGETYNYNGAGHLCGTHRMGDDWHTAVVNSDQRAWDHENLYIAGSGSHVSVGTQNPTLTLMAMTMRTTDAIMAA